MGFSAEQLANASLALQIGGVASSTFGSYYGAATQKANLYGQAGVAESNARIAELQAQDELAKGQHQIGKLTLAAGQMKSSQRASMAANGVDLGVGNAAEVQASTDLMKEVDMQTAELNAIKGAWGYRAQKANFENEAYAARASAKGIKPLMSAATTLIGGASQVAASWNAVKQTSTQSPPSQSGEINSRAKAFKYRPAMNPDAYYLSGGKSAW